jgi:4'-phosphopantetheinyl transferase
MSERGVLYPVILRVPAGAAALSRPERVRRLSELAREALRHSAALKGLTLGALDKDPAGAPIPSRGVFWSLTHKPGYVAGVAARSPVGIDIESVRNVKEGMYAKVAGEAEWALLREDRLITFFRFWTAKEAVLKTGGRGLADLSACRVTAVPDAVRLFVAYRDRIWEVRQRRFGDHMAALAGGEAGVEWVLPSFPAAVSSLTPI